MWVLDHLDDVESDLSAFHRIDDPMSLDSPRFFRLAERLHHYDGAVRAARRRRPAEQEDWTPPPPVTTAEEPQVDVAAIAAMSQHPGFPGIKYTGG